MCPVARRLAIFEWITTPCAVVPCIAGWLFKARCADQDSPPLRRGVSALISPSPARSPAGRAEAASGRTARRTFRPPASGRRSRTCCVCATSDLKNATPILCARGRRLAACAGWVLFRLAPGPELRRLHGPRAAAGRRNHRLGVAGRQLPKLIEAAQLRASAVHLAFEVCRPGGRRPSPAKGPTGRPADRGPAARLAACQRRSRGKLQALSAVTRHPKRQARAPGSA